MNRNGLSGHKPFLSSLLIHSQKQKKIMRSRRCDESTNFLSRPINYLYLFTIFSGTKNNGKNIRSRKYKKRFFASLTSCSHFYFRRRRKNQNKIDGNIQSRPKAGNEKRGNFLRRANLWPWPLFHFSSWNKNYFPICHRKIKISCSLIMSNVTRWILFFFNFLFINSNFVCVDPKS